MIDSSVRSGWLEFTRPLEGCISWPYKDVLGLVTIGYGCLIKDKPMALADGVPEWVFDAVSTQPAGLPAIKYNWGWHMAPDKLDVLAMGRLDNIAEDLSRQFPDFASWSPQAQQATLSMAWAMGSGFPSTWPKWSVCAHNLDWAGCADNCEISTVGNPGVAPRNKANKSLFLAAANASASA